MRRCARRWRRRRWQGPKVVVHILVLTFIATGRRARDGFLRVPIQAPDPTGGRVSNRFLRVLGAEEPLVGAQVLEASG